MPDDRGEGKGKWRYYIGFDREAAAAGLPVSVLASGLTRAYSRFNPIYT